MWQRCGSARWRGCDGGTHARRYQPRPHCLRFPAARADNGLNKQKQIYRSVILAKARTSGQEISGVHTISQQHQTPPLARLEPRCKAPDISPSLHPARGPRFRKDDGIIYRCDKRLGGEFRSARCHPQRLSLWRRHAVWRSLQLLPPYIKLSPLRRRGPRDKKSQPPISVSQQTSTARPLSLAWNRCGRRPISAPRSILPEVHLEFAREFKRLSQG